MLVSENAAVSREPAGTRKRLTLRSFSRVSSSSRSGSDCSTIPAPARSQVCPSRWNTVRSARAASSAPSESTVTTAPL